ncbi:MAG TPA: hypothetical protein VH025_03570 [Solirubrobacteraceae bacterium]|nr:hypothetical protein [Solirubrobacteraceae bacterium]
MAEGRPIARRAREHDDTGALTQMRPLGERPQAPWHPLPLSEILILVGGIAAIVGVKRGPDTNRSTILAGVAAVAIGTLEVSLREHLSGYRSHTWMLSVIPALAVHTAIVLVLAAFTTVPRAANVPLLMLDGAIVWFMFKLLRARFLDARRERLFQS